MTKGDFFSKNYYFFVLYILLFIAVGIHHVSLAAPIETRDGEFLIDTNAFYVAEPSYQGSSSIVAGESCFLAVWDDRRYDTVPNIYGVRIALDGTIIDHSGIEICSNPSYQGYVSCATDSTQFFVTWTDRRDNAWSNIYGARVNQSGAVLDPQGIPICKESNSQNTSALAFDGANYLVVWNDFRNSPGPDTNIDIYGTFVTSAGIVSDTIGFPVSTANNRQQNPSIAFDGTNYLVVWRDERNDTTDIYGTRVTPSGIVLDTNGIPISTATGHQQDPAVIFGGGYYLVAWQDWRNQATLYDIYGARVTPSGTVMDTAGFPIISIDYTQWSVALSFDGTNYVATWEDERLSPGSDIYCSRISQSGQVLDSGGIAVSVRDQWQSNPSVAFCYPYYCIVWDDETGGGGWFDEDIWGARLSGGGIIIDTAGFVVSTTVNPQKTPAAAFDGTNYFCCWRDNNNPLSDTADIYGTRITPTGVILDSMPFMIGNNCLKGQFSPAVAFDDTNYTVVWETLDTLRGNQYGYKIYAVRVNPAGAMLDSTDIFIGQYTVLGSYDLAPDIDFADSNYLVAWGDLEVIYGVLVTRGGAVIDSNPLVISPNFGDCYNPAVRSTANNFLVVYESWDNYPTNWDIRGTRVTTDGAILDTNSIPIAVWTDNQMRPEVGANDAGDYFVAWQDWRNSNWDIYGARVTGGGTILDSSGIAICTSPGNQTLPVVSYDGTYYIVIWQDLRDSTDWQLYGAQINSSGTVISTYEVCMQLGSQFTPELTRGNNDQLLLTYSGWTDSINSHDAKTMRIWGKFYPFTGVKETEEARMKEYDLRINPNPFRKACHLKYDLKQAADVNILIYDVAGRCVKAIAAEKQNAGSHCVACNLQDMSYGVYFIKLVSRNASEIIKVVLLK